MGQSTRREELAIPDPRINKEPPVIRPREAGEVFVISSDLDGAQLRRAKRTNPRHIRAHGMKGGHGDEEVINEALHGGRNFKMSVPAHIWERIFGGNHVNG